MTLSHLSPIDQSTINQIVNFIRNRWDTDAIYLYGSRAKGLAHKESDWDIGVLFSHYLSDPVERSLRPQEIQAYLEKELHLYEKIDVVDVEIAPVPLQYNIIRGIKVYDKNIPHVKHVEHAIYSRVEKDYYDSP